MANSTLLNDYLGVGTHAARPATPPVGSLAAFYYETDTTNTFIWTGSAWSQVNGGSAGALTLITEVVTSGSQATVAFGSIPGTYRDLVLRVRGRVTAAVTETGTGVQFNGDTGANYDLEQMAVSGTSVSNTENIGITSISVLNLPGSTATAGRAGGGEMKIFDYRGTTFHKNAVSLGGDAWAATSPSNRIMAQSGIWRSTAAITSILLFLGAGSFVDGSVVSLYGSL
jgi:hypothetical protein